jgi:hypothetical protein
VLFRSPCVDNYEEKSFGIGTKIVLNRCVGCGTWYKLVTQYYSHIFLCTAIFVRYLRVPNIKQQLSPNASSSSSH